MIDPRAVALALACALGTGCGGGTAARVGAPPSASRTPSTFPAGYARGAPVPDSSGWGTHVLSVACAPDGAVWVGTYGQGIYVTRDGTGAAWENLRSGDEPGRISWNFVNAFAFAPGEVWYGTIGNGWGLSRDEGRTWRNWTFDELGPRWLYVAPGGLLAAGDTLWVATADGLRRTTDDGETWTDAVEESGLPTRYLTGLRAERRSAGTTLLVRHPRGVSGSEDGGRTWSAATAGDAAVFEADAAWLEGCSDVQARLVRELIEWREGFRRYGDAAGPAAEPGNREHFWFRRPIAPDANPHLDQTYTYGSTMGGNFQQHQGVEFNNPAGTPVHAVGPGVVRYAGEAEAGSHTVAILHDRRLDGGFVWSTYYHNSELAVKAGDRVEAGQVIARVGSTGRATNDHVHLEVHVTPTPDSSQVVHPDVRFPPFTRNPQLWIEPLPGTGAIAGRVLDAEGRPVAGARVYGVTKPAPVETPLSFAETYEDRAHPDPVFEENFAIGDVRAGRYVLGVEIGPTRVYRDVRVAPGRVTEVTLRP